MQQMALDGWFLRQDIVERLLSSGSENDEALAFGDRTCASLPMTGLNIRR